MPPRDKPQVTIGQYLKVLKVANDRILEMAVKQSLFDTSEWMLYCDKSLRGGLARQIVDGHGRFALKQFTIEPKFDIRTAARNMLGRGCVLVRRDVEEPTEWEIEDPAYIRKVKFKREKPVYVEIEYTYCDHHPVFEKMAQPVEFTYEAVYFYRDRQPVKRWRTYKVGDDPENIPWKEEALSEFPYRGVDWITGDSILAGYSMDIIRHSELLEEIEGENRRKSRMAIHYSGVSSFADSVEEQKEAGRVILGKDGQAWIPDTNPAAANPMFQEAEMIEQLVRDGTGYVKVMALHNSSGTARQYEYWPLESQALAIRAKMFTLMEQLFGDSFKLWLPPLIQLTPAEVQIELLNLYQAADVDRAITRQEKNERERDILQFESRRRLTDSSGEV